MNIRAVDYVQIGVADFARSVAFYRDTLGLQESFRNDDWKWAEFDVGNITLALCQNGTGEGNAVVVALAVDDIDDALRELQDKGVQIDRAPMSGDWCTQFSILDPDGHPVFIHRRKDGTSGAQLSGES